MKLAKTLAKQARSSCYHLQSVVISLSRCPSYIWTGLLCRRQLSCTAIDRQTLAHTCLPPRMAERQQAGQTRHCLGSAERYAWSCQELNLGVRAATNLSASAVQNGEEVCRQLRLGRYGRFQSASMQFDELKWRRPIARAMHS